APLGTDPAEQGTHIGLLGHVGLDDQGLTAQSTHTLSSLLRSLQPGVVVDHHVTAGVSQVHGARTADAPRGPGDQGNRSGCEIHRQHAHAAAPTELVRDSIPTCVSAAITFGASGRCRSIPLSALAGPKPTRAGPKSSANRACISSRQRTGAHSASYRSERICPVSVL